jgi:hypothetical protein
VVVQVAVGVKVMVGVGVEVLVGVGVREDVGVKVSVDVAVVVAKSPLCDNALGRNSEEINTAISKAKPPMNQRGPPGFPNLGGAMPPVFNTTK